MAATDLARRLVDSLYTEAMLLADETRSYFEDRVAEDRRLLTPALRVELSCEALKGTVRLMQLIAWLLVRKAVAAGEMADAEAAMPARRLGDVPPFETATMLALPTEARRLLAAGADLYERVRRLDQTVEMPEPPISPARSLMARLERSI